VFQRMLVPLDGTRSSAAVLPYAVDLAAHLRCRVDLLLVEPSHGGRLPHPEHHARKHGGPATASPLEVNIAYRRYLERHAADFQAHGLETACHVRSGDPVEEILRAALELRCDVIAMTTLNRDRYAYREGVSVSREVLWRSRLPVLLLAEG
jgi:nucleotide-binding universal stress UspA family protein